MIPLRFTAFLAGFLGVIYTLAGLFHSLADTGAGLAVAAASVLVWGICDWIEER